MPACRATCRACLWLPPPRVRRLAHSLGRAYLGAGLVVLSQTGCIVKPLQRAFRKCAGCSLSLSRSRDIPQKPSFWDPARARPHDRRMDAGPEPVRDGPWDRLEPVVVSKIYRLALWEVDLDRCSSRYGPTKPETAPNTPFWGWFGTYRTIGPEIRICCDSDRLELLELSNTYTSMCKTRAETQSSSL